MQACRGLVQTKWGWWLYTYIDLDEIEQGTMGLIPFPVAQEPPQEFASLAGSEQGTLVVWSKYDNLRMRLLELLAEIKPWAAAHFDTSFGMKGLKENKSVHTLYHHHQQRSYSSTRPTLPPNGKNEVLRPQIRPVR